MYKTRNVYWIMSFWIVLMAASCTKPTYNSDDPKGRLTDYISKSFSVKSSEDKAQLLSFLTGDVKARLERWSDDQFREAFVDSKRKYERLYFREVKVVSPDEVEITYELTYLDQGKGQDGKNRDAKVTNKKLCQMTRENGKWFISDVRNIKELIEYQHELSLP